MAIKSCWYRLGGKGVTRCPWCARTAVSMLATPLQPNRPACGAGLRSLEWPAKTNHALIPETSASEPHPIFHFTRTWKCLLFLAHFSGHPKARGRCSQTERRSSDWGLCQNRRLCGYFSSWLTTHSQHFCGLAYLCADFFCLGPH